MASLPEEQQPSQQPQQPSRETDEQQENEGNQECKVIVHKTKTIQFFNRSTPIVLQNDNGPCPLLAICNVLLLRNQLDLNPDISEVSQEKLLSLVAEKLIDLNSNVNNKDPGYVENQERNIADALEILPRLTTGIDVNIKFRRIDDFEFTPECTIFDLLDIPLYHGWLVDPQDHETAVAIGSKSYNTLMGDLVSLETRTMEDGGKDKLNEDCVDFAAATTATLGVPSPCLSRGKSFDESPHYSSDQPILRKGDAEEEAEVLRVLKASEYELPAKENSGASATSEGDMMMTSDEHVSMMKSIPENPVDISEVCNCTGSSELEPSISGVGNVPENCDRKVSSCEQLVNLSDSTYSEERHIDQLIVDHSGVGSTSNDVGKCAIDAPTICDPIPSFSLDKDAPHEQEVESLSTPVADLIDGLNKQNLEESSVVTGHADSESSSGRIPSIGAVESFTSSLDGSEPIYEGEECILDSGKSVCEDREPVYEGEVVLAEQADKGTRDVCEASPKDELSVRQGELISNFLRSNANQLTFYGLFCLQEGLKERELCVFFRNNHFSTMYKFEGELYLLATDQGYMNQPDLVWEKLNEVNGDTLFMNSNFKEFKLESSANGTWDEQNAVSSTADYLASIDSSAQAGSNTNSDLQLAIALQQQEFEQQPQRNAPQQQSVSGSSRLITGPQAPRSSARPTSSSTQRQDQKAKDKSNCKIM